MLKPLFYPKLNSYSIIVTQVIDGKIYFTFNGTEFPNYVNKKISFNYNSALFTGIFSYEINSGGRENFIYDTSDWATLSGILTNTELTVYDTFQVGESNDLITLSDALLKLNPAGAKFSIFGNSLRRIHNTTSGAGLLSILDKTKLDKLPLILKSSDLTIGKVWQTLIMYKVSDLTSERNNKLILRDSSNKVFELNFGFSKKYGTEDLEVTAEYGVNDMSILPLLQYSLMKYSDGDFVLIDIKIDAAEVVTTKTFEAYVSILTENNLVAPAGNFISTETLNIKTVASGGTSGPVIDGNGIVSGVSLSTTADTDKFKINSGILHFSSIGLKTQVEIDNIVITNLLTNLVTYVAIDSTGTVIQKTTPFTFTERRTYCILGVVVHSDHVLVNAINNLPDVGVTLLNQFNDLLDSIGNFNKEGNEISANGANLRINKSIGKIFKRGVNFQNDPTNPHCLELAALTAPATIRYRLSDSTEYSNTQLIDLSYESAPGVKTALPGNRFSIQRISIFPSNLIRIQYGQHLYNSLAEAKQSINSETFTTEKNISENGLLRCFLIVKGSCTDLTSDIDASFIESDKFGKMPIGGTTGTTTLQQAYSNSAEPEILTSVANGAFSIRRGSALDTDNVFEILNGAGVIVATIKGNGNIEATNLSNTNTGDETSSTILNKIGNGSVISSIYLPSFVDDVLEYANLAAFPATGEAGKIYVDLTSNKTYRWGGSSYIYITSGAVDSVNGKTGIVVLTQDDITDGTTYKQYSATEKSKLAGISAGAQVNNISDVNAGTLTSGADASTLHDHSDKAERLTGLTPGVDELRLLIPNVTTGDYDKSFVYVCKTETELKNVLAEPGTTATKFIIVPDYLALLTGTITVNGDAHILVNRSIRFTGTTNFVNTGAGASSKLYFNGKVWGAGSIIMNYDNASKELYIYSRYCDFGSNLTLNKQNTGMLYFIIANAISGVTTNPTITGGAYFTRDDTTIWESITHDTISGVNSGTHRHLSAAQVVGLTGGGSADAFHTHASGGAFLYPSIWVDASQTSDANGLRGDKNKPFKTLEAARDVAQDGDNIYVSFGTYTVTTTSTNGLSKSGINWIFEKGCLVSKATAGHMFRNDSSFTKSCNIYGYAEFSKSSAGSYIWSSAINPLTDVAEFNAIRCTCTGGSACLYLESGGFGTFKINVDYATSTTSILGGIAFANLFINFIYWKSTDADTISANNTSGKLFINGFKLESTYSYAYAEGGNMGMVNINVHEIVGVTYGLGLVSQATVNCFSVTGINVYGDNAIVNFSGTALRINITNGKLIGGFTSLLTVGNTGYVKTSLACNILSWYYAGITQTGGYAKVDILGCYGNGVDLQMNITGGILDLVTMGNNLPMYDPAARVINGGDVRLYNYTTTDLNSYHVAMFKLLSGKLTLKGDIMANAIPGAIATCKYIFVQWYGGKLIIDGKICMNTTNADSMPIRALNTGLKLRVPTSYATNKVINNIAGFKSKWKITVTAVAATSVAYQGYRPNPTYFSGAISESDITTYNTTAKLAKRLSDLLTADGASPLHGEQDNPNVDDYFYAVGDTYIEDILNFYSFVNCSGISVQLNSVPYEEICGGIINENINIE